MNIVFVALNLDRGGAERQMVTLAGALSQRGHRVTVLVFRGGGPFESLLPVEVEVIDLGRRSRWTLPVALIRLVRAVRRIEPDWVHPYLAAPNALVGILQPFLGGARVVWGLRHAELALGERPLGVRAAFKLSVALSRRISGHIVNSQAGLEWHVRQGFPSERMRLVPNGIDLDRFAFDAEARERIRRAWDLEDGEFAVGMVARTDRLKDHATFISAARALRSTGEPTRFFCIGAAQELPDDAVEWLPPAPNPAEVYSALDLVCMSSIAEGFPNVPAEAMACGTPCVVSDVGDAATIVGDHGWVVPAGDVEAMASAIRDAARAPKPEKSTLRRRIEQNWSVDLLVERTEAALADLAGARA